MKEGMTLIVKTITRFVGVMIMLFGVYIVLHGHLSPGGGFAGGVILASGFILLTLAFGKNASLKIFSQRAASDFESFGALIFLSVALLGFTGGFFFLNFLPKGEAGELISAGIIPVCNIGIGIKVGAALFAVFMALIILRIRRGKEE
jgi:multisubunit Na+/H+ antiporter MnhB subunit